jgi:hypothetical protein
MLSKSDDSGAGPQHDSAGRGHTLCDTGQSFGNDGR